MPSSKSIAKSIQKNIKNWRNSKGGKIYSALLCSYERNPGVGGFISPAGAITKECEAVRGFLGAISKLSVINRIASLELGISDWSTLGSDKTGGPESFTVEITFQTVPGVPSEQLFEAIIVGFSEIGQIPTVGTIHTDYSAVHADPDPGEA